MELAEIEALCRELAFRGVEFEQIRKELEQFQLPAEERREMLDKADEFIVQYQLYQQHKARVLGGMLLAAAILIVGLAVTVGTYLSDGSRYSIGFAAILAGYWLLRKGYAKYKEPPGRYEIRGLKKRSKFNRF